MGELTRKWQHMAAQKAGEASLVTVDAGVPPVRAEKKMAALMAAVKADAA